MDISQFGAFGGLVGSAVENRRSLGSLPSEPLLIAAVSFE
jgi:hypothetical protein